MKKKPTYEELLAQIKDFKKEIKNLKSASIAGETTSKSSRFVKSEKFNSLRKLAEKKLELLGSNNKKRKKSDLDELPELIHDLEVYQIELEIQNEELNKTQAQLTEAYEKYRDLYDNAPAGYFTLSHDGKIVDLNNFATLLIGYKKGDIVNNFFVKLLKREDHKNFLNCLKEVFFTGKKQICEVLIEKKDNTLRYAQLSVTALIDEKGKIKNYKIIAEDITEKKKQREQIEKHSKILEKTVKQRTQKLQEVVKKLEKEIKAREILSGDLLSREKYLEALFENTLEAILVADDNGNYFDANSAVSKMIGYSLEEIKSMSVKELIAPENLEKAITKWDEFIKHKTQSGEIELVAKGGSTIICEYRAVADFIPGYHLSVLTDITDRKHYLDKLEKNNAFIKAILDNLPIGVAVNEFDSGFASYMNKKFVDIYGHPEEKLTDVSGFFDLVYPDPDYRKIIENRILNDIQSGDPNRMKWDDIVITTSTGEKRIISAVNIPIIEQNLMVSTVQDMTERKHAQEQIQKSEQYLRTILQTTVDGFWIVNSEKKFIEVNEAYCRMSGYSREEILQLEVSAIDAIEDQDEISRRIKEIMSKGSLVFETKHRRKDGSIFDVEVSVTFLNQDGGKLICFCRDITERKRGQLYRNLSAKLLQLLNEPADLHESLEKVLREIQTSTECDAVGIRLQYKEDYPYFVQHGFSEEFIKMENSLIKRSSDAGVCRNQDGSISLECTCGLVISGKTDSSNPLFTPGGSCWTNDSFPLLDLPENEDPRTHPRNKCIHWNYASVALIPLRKKQKIVGLLQLNAHRKGKFSIDVIEELEGIANQISEALMRKQAEEELRQSEEKFRQITENMGEVFWLRNEENNKMLYINPAYEKVWGRTCQSLYDNPRSFIDTVYEPDKPAVFAEYEKYMKTGIFNLDYRIVRPDGKIRWINARTFPVKDSYDKIIRHTGIAVDITSRKEVEEIIQQKNEELNSINAQKDKFFSIIAHDLRSPFQGFLGLTKTLSEEYLTFSINEMIEINSSLYKAAVNLYKLLENLLEWTRIQSGKMNFNPELINVAFLIGLNLESIKQSAAMKEISIESNVPDSLQVFADEKMIGTVIRNLLSNSVKFTNRGGKVLISANELNRDNIEIRVEDNGIGIPKEVIDNLFRVDVRTNTEGTEGEPSTGLGLVLCNEFIKKHDGEIFVESEVGKGTTFSFHLKKENLTKEIE